MSFDYYNTEEGVNHVKAFRTLYSSAKKYAAFRNSLNIVGMIFVSLIYLAFSHEWLGLPKKDLSWVVAAYSLAIIVTDKLLLSPVISEKVRSAATIQQQLDCSVFDIEWNDTLFGIKQSYIDIVSWAIKDKTSIEESSNWYNRKIDQLPEEMKILLCQNVNCWWDSVLRSFYSNVLIVIGFIMMASCIGLSCYAGVSIRNFFALFVAPIVPYLLFTIDTVNANSASISRCRRAQESLLATIDRYEKKNISYDQVSRFTVEMQYFLLYHRMANPLVPDCVYKLTQKRNEVIVDEATNYHVESYLKKQSTFFVDFFNP